MRERRQELDRQHPEKGDWLAELGPGDHFVGFYLAQQPRLETFRDPSRGSYLRLVLCDRSGSLEARVWDEAQEAAAEAEKGVVKVEGEVEEYRERLQGRVLRLRAAQESEYVLADLIRSTGRDVDEMLSEIDRRIEQFDDPDLQGLVQHFYADEAFRSAFQEAPAAQQIHHAYRGGLLEHVYEVLLLSDTLVDLYPSLNRDLLTTGILLHDIGKLREISTGPDPAYTDQGQLLGHIAIGAAAVAKAIDDQPDFPQQLAWQVQHLILSHHGRHEWGSPRRPKTLEAIALHHLEHLDGQVNRFDDMLRAARQRGAAWTGYDYRLGRSLYAGENDLTIEEQRYLD